MAAKKKNLPAQDTEVPLDPQQEAMVRKLKRMAVFSSILMIGGFLAIFAVIGYRLSNPVSAPQAAPIPAITNALPKGSRVISTAVSDGRIVVTIEREGRTEVRVFDLSTLQLRGTLRLEPQ
ncbi:MAG: hypothetical protein KF826_10100 [Xanthobacteraceae bacterium]|nr:hypothetical protein [Xanthobacteraceae bacterium]MBX3534692.1 hypothetical protein [Xanthobacteraceae bacterium]MBX3549708.1 hypothetical protein [Xanthobacteraceae bacterium]MCW5675153.1 hypothetical protein [Xanthobacteraceae bacterium]MCW5676806.1 hypothetical protein [Xanthobacteraceae bacterium]